MMRTTTLMLSLILFVATAVLSAQGNTAAEAKKCVIEISDMACSSCATTIQKALIKMDGVKAAEVSQPSGTASITYDSSKTDPVKLAKAITKKTGFPAKPRVER